MTTNENFVTELKKILEERQEEYGDLKKNLDRVIPGWNVILEKHNITHKQICLCMIWFKVCREINQSKHDNYLDIAGYAGLLDELDEELF